MPRSPQDVYARLLSSPRGYPLWTPEPSNELLMERRDGLRIGDVGVVIPDDGGFDVFFNICLPADHPFHRRYGVPEGFTCINPGELDIRTIPSAEYPGRIISTSSVTRVETAELSSDTPQRDESSALAYRFTLSSNDGALLILPKGAERYDLLNEGLFLEQASRHGAEWYDYAVNRRHRIISHDSLYLITGFYKACSWSVAAFEDVVGNEHHTAHFKRVQGYGAGPTYSWETTCALDWRVGPHIEYDIANQAVFIRGFKIALRTGFLGTRRISVEADLPSTRSNPVKLSSIVPSNSRLLGSLATLLGRDGGSNVSRTTAHNPGTTDSIEERPRSDVSNRSGYDDMHVEIQRMPDVPTTFHPSDAINQYLLHKEPSANIAVTHDSHWISMLEDGLLTPEEFGHVHESRLETVLSQNYRLVSREGVIRLERKGDLDASDGNVPLRSRGKTSLVDTPTSVVSDTLATFLQKTRNQHSHQEMTGGRSVDTRSAQAPPLPTNYPQWNKFLPNKIAPSVSSPSSVSNPSSDPPPYDTLVERTVSANVLVVGETGVGKSSVINLIAGERIADVSPSASGCTMEATSYDVVLNDSKGHNHHVRLFDTVGLKEPSLSKNDYLTAIEKANVLTTWLLRAGGIRLLIFCIRGGRITSVTQKNYRLFCDILCQNQVPVAFVITGMENEQPMEGWWNRNIALFERSNLSCVSHVCVTATPGLNNVYAKQYQASQTAIHSMLLTHMSGTSWKPERTGWFIHLAGKLSRLITKPKDRKRHLPVQSRALTVKELARHLEDKCNFTREEAVELAGKIWAKRTELSRPDFVKGDDADELSDFY